MKMVFNIIKNHKVITSTICGIFALAIVGVVGYQHYKLNNTYKAMEFAQDGIISTEELNELGDIALGEEITTPDGQKVIITQDANGNYIVTPTNPDTPTPTPSHTHIWVAHKTIIHHPEVSHKEGRIYCTTCHADITNKAVYAAHTCKDGHFSTTTKTVKVVDQAAWDQEVVDYYYCSDCGARQ